MMDVEQIAKGLTEAQVGCIIPGPGNPEYARGALASMKSLLAKGIVEYVNPYADDGKRGGHLMPLGQTLRDHILQSQTL